MFEQYNKEIRKFCNSFNVTNIEELQPYWCPDRLSNMSTDSLKFMAICVVKAAESLGKKINQLVKVEKRFGVYTPFFDSGYYGISLIDKFGNEFYFCINEGHVGPDDQYEAFCEINKQKINLVYNSRKYGDVHMHNEDEKKNIDICTSVLIKNFLKNSYFI